MTTRLLRRAGLTMAVLAASLAIAVPVSAAPAGSNGTIKIDGRAWDDLPNNEPHVGCEFQVDFYNYDLDNTVATVSFDAQEPSGDGAVGFTADPPGPIFIGGDDNGGGTDLDASVTFTLNVAGLTEHPQQGYHIKLTVTAPGSNGPDTKHKVFWVTDCDPCEDPPTDPNQDV